MMGYGNASSDPKYKFISSANTLDSCILNSLFIWVSKVLFLQITLDQHLECLLRRLFFLWRIYYSDFLLASLCSFTTNLLSCSAKLKSPTTPFLAWGALRALANLLLMMATSTAAFITHRAICPDGKAIINTSFHFTVTSLISGTVVSVNASAVNTVVSGAIHTIIAVFIGSAAAVNTTIIGVFTFFASTVSAAKLGGSISTGEWITIASSISTINRIVSIFSSTTAKAVAWITLLMAIAVCFAIQAVFVGFTDTITALSQTARDTVLWARSTVFCGFAISVTTAT